MKFFKKSVCILAGITGLLIFGCSEMPTMAEQDGANAGEKKLTAFKYPTTVSPIGGDLAVNQRHYSPNKEIHLIFQSDGNLVLYRGSYPIWNSGTWVSWNKGHSCQMQDDGNLVIKDINGKCIWESQTGSFKDAVLIIRDNGRVEIICTHFAIWRNGKLLAGPSKIAMYEELVVDKPYYSDNREYRLVFQSDGNLVLYNRSSWIGQSHTYDHPRKPTTCYLRRDGLIAMFDGHTFPVWDSKITGHWTERYISINDDGSLTINDKGTDAVHWSYRLGDNGRKVFRGIEY